MCPRANLARKVEKLWGGVEMSQMSRPPEVDGQAFFFLLAEQESIATVERRKQPVDTTGTICCDSCCYAVLC